MPVTDPIADMITVIRNGVRAKKDTVEVKRSKVTESILTILKNEEYISNFKSIDDNKQGIVKVYLKYDKDTPAIADVKRISRPGRRTYVKSDEIKSVLGGIGMALISTSHGIMTDKDAKEKNLGGEFLCEVW